MAEHTPGPWEVVSPRLRGANSRRIFSGNEYIGHVGASDTRERELQANARLIAAAPELLTAAVKAFAELNEIRARDGVPYTSNGWKASVCPDYFSSIVDELNAAVEKATGKSAHCHPELYKKSEADQ